MNTDKIPFIIRLPLVLVSVIAIGYLLSLGQIILAPLTFAIFTATMFLPFANYLEKKLRLSRGWSTVISVLLLIIVLSGICYFFAYQLSDLVNDWPKLQKQIEVVFHRMQIWFFHNFSLNLDDQMEYLKQAAEKLASTSSLIIGITIGMFSSSVFFFFLSIIFFMAVLNYRRILYKFIRDVFTQRHISKVEEILSEVQIMVKHYLAGLIIQIIIVFVIVSAFLTIMGVKYAILLAAITGFLNVIPYIGIGVSLIITLIISFATGSSANILILVLGFLATHSIDANITLPFVIGSKVKINALFSFLAILVGEAIWGISGMFLCIPILGVLKIIFDRVDGLQPWGLLIGDDETHSRRRRKKEMKQEAKRVELEKTEE
jgi:predicted PurR-regulated permease PerM